MVPGKDHGSGKSPDLPFPAPDKQRICYAYQKKSCKLDHLARVCAKCLGSHPICRMPAGVTCGPSRLARAAHS